jgi:hypothetical protein
MKSHVLTIICILVFIISLHTTFGQDIDSISQNKNQSTKNSHSATTIELLLNFPYHFLKYPEWLIMTNRPKVKNSFNFGAGLLVSRYFKPMKISGGLYFSSRNYFHEFYTMPGRIVDKITYLNIPLKLSGQFWKISIYAGFCITTPLTFNNLNNKDLRKEINTLETLRYDPYHQPFDYPLTEEKIGGITILTGLTFSQRLYNSLFLNITFSYERKVYEDIQVYETPRIDIYSLDKRYLIEGLNSISLNFGLEYFFYDRK